MYTLRKSILALACLCLAGQSVVCQETNVIDISNRREIFVDDFLIDRFDGVELKMHHPVERGNVLEFDKPWEGRFSAYCTVIRDGDLYRMYYRGQPVDTRKLGEGEVTCYAESIDGINWNKPELGLFEVDGDSRNNIILIDSQYATHNFCPFLDANPNTKFRYKALGGSGKIGLFAYGSKDGIKWEKLNDEPVLRGAPFDTQNVAFWSESEGQYVCYYRVFYKNFRSIKRATSKDFLNWTTGELMGYGGAPVEDLYTQQTSPYFRAPHIYLAIGARFMKGRKVISDDEATRLGVDASYYSDCSDVFLMSSRGGTQYDRTFMDAFIRPGIGLNNWVSRTNYPVLNVVQTDDTELSIYVNEDYAQPSAHIKRYSLRLDGFTSLHAGYEGGLVVTKPFIFSGKQLELNYATSAAGLVRIEVLDEIGDSIAGYMLDDAQEIIGNETNRIAYWKGGRDLRELEGKTIRLRIHMKDADIYSIKFN